MYTEHERDSFPNDKPLRDAEGWIDPLWQLCQADDSAGIERLITGIQRNALEAAARAIDGMSRYDDDDYEKAAEAIRTLKPRFPEVK